MEEHNFQELEKLKKIAEEGELFFNDDELLPFSFGQYEKYQEKNWNVVNNPSEGTKSLSYWMGEPILDDVEGLNHLELSERIQLISRMFANRGVILDIIQEDLRFVYKTIQRKLEEINCDEKDLEGMNLEI